MSFERFNILVCGQSGRGKSTSIEPLMAEYGDKLTVISSELKALPFKGEQLYAETYPELCKLLKEFKADPNKELLVLDSITKVSGWISNDSYEENKDEENGFAEFRSFQRKFSKFIDSLNRLGKRYICISLDEFEANSSNRQAKVAGKALDGAIESSFICVLWSVMEIVDGKPKYQFMTQTDGKNAAKTPRGMIEEQYIPNDLALVMRKAKEHYAVN